MVFCLSRLVCLRVGDILKKVLYHGLWVDSDAVFTVSFGSVCAFRSTREFSFSSLGGTTSFMKLRSILRKNPKSATKFVRPTSYR